MNDDADLWQKFAEGDKRTFEHLILTYYNPLFDYGIKFTPDREKVKDHIHDLFTSLWHKRASLRPVDQIKPYLLKCLRNRIFKEFHRTDMLINLHDRENTIFESDETMEMKIISEEFTVERERRILFIIGKLTRRQREIIHLKFYEDLSNEEIADVLSISRGSVANLLHETLKLFREKWKLLLYSLIHIVLSF